MTTNPLTVTAPEGVPFIDFEREFDAPVESVFRAHAEPDLVKQWLGPRGYEMKIEHYDFRTGGGYRYVHSNPAGERVRLQRRVPHRPPQRVRHPDVRVRGLPRHRQHRVDDVRGPRRRPLADPRPLRVPDLESRDGMVASNMESGMSEGYQRLDELLAAQ